MNGDSSNWLVRSLFLIRRYTADASVVALPKSNHVEYAPALLLGNPKGNTRTLSLLIRQ